MKTVYIIGAGTAIDAGIPSSTGIFEKAQDIAQKNAQSKKEPLKIFIQDTKRLYENILEYLSGLPGRADKTKPGAEYAPLLSEDYVKEFEKYVDFQDDGSAAFKDGIYPEDMVDTMVSLRKFKTGTNVNDDNNIGYISTLYFHTIFYCEYVHSFQKKCAYKRIAENFDIDTDVIVSFNYDTILDRMLKKKYGAFDLKDYYIPGQGKSAYGASHFYKPHKSLNWFQCAKCGAVFLDWKYSQLPGYRQLSVYKITETPCCGHDTANSMLVIPSQHKDRDDLWKYGWKIDKNEMYAIEKHLKQADEVIISGYSLPEQDTYFREVLFNSLGNEKKNTKIYIVNNGLSGARRVGDNLYNLLSAEGGNSSWEIWLAKQNYGDCGNPLKGAIRL